MISEKGKRESDKKIKKLEEAAKAKQRDDAILKKTGFHPDFTINTENSGMSILTLIIFKLTMAFN